MEPIGPPRQGGRTCSQGRRARAAERARRAVAPPSGPAVTRTPQLFSMRFAPPFASPTGRTEHSTRIRPGARMRHLPTGNSGRRAADSASQSRPARAKPGNDARGSADVPACNSRATRDRCVRHSMVSARRTLR